jgi:hypothetical protein
MVILTIGTMFIHFTCMHFWDWGILRWSACETTSYEVVRDCQKFEKDCIRLRYPHDIIKGLISSGGKFTCVVMCTAHH